MIGLVIGSLLYKCCLSRENGCGRAAVVSFSGKWSLYRRFLGEGKGKMRGILRAIALMVAATSGPAFGDGEKAGDFDYYVMSLSWSPAWCEMTGEARGDPQCDAGRGLSWTLHGLWPQYEDGWPQYCRTVQRDPTRGETAAMADIMGGAGLAFHEWKKHGRCSGLSAQGYYAASRQAFQTLRMPPVFAQIDRDLTVPASVIEEAFLEANPSLQPDQITVLCDDGLISEVRLCLTPDLEPRRCAPDVIRDCRMKDAVLEAVR
jgi:ribonuclease T2